MIPTIPAQFIFILTFVVLTFGFSYIFLIIAFSWNFLVTLRNTYASKVLQNRNSSTAKSIIISRVKVFPKIF